MESQEFVVLYTHQKMKKSKVWQDGRLKVTPLGNKAILYDDKGQCLESFFLKCPEVKPGDDLESDRHLITVEEVRVPGSVAGNQDIVQQVTSSGRSLGCQPAGLKRKFTGFQGPRQVPKKMVIVENGEQAASLETADSGAVFLSPFPRASSLFSAAGKTEVKSVPADHRSAIICKDGGRESPPLCAAGPAPSARSDPQLLWEGGRLSPPVGSADKRSVPSLTSEPLKGDGWAPHCSGLTQNMRSRAQILALLKSKSASVSKDMHSEMTGPLLWGQPQGNLKTPTKPRCFIEQEECAEGGAESLQYQWPSESTVRSRSRWAVYLSSQRSPVCSSTEDGSDLERKPEAQGDDTSLNRRDLLIPKTVQLFAAGAENGKKYEDKLAGNTDSSGEQEVRLEIPSLCENNSLPITYGPVKNNGLVSESDIQENTKIPVNQRNQICRKGPIIRENALAISAHGIPGKENEHTVSYLPEPEPLQSESSLRNSSGISDVITDRFSRSNTGSESLSLCGPMTSITQPVLEVNFNLNNFEISDSEEESQDRSQVSPDPEGWGVETSAADGSSRVRGGREGVCCEEGDGARFPPLTPLGGEPAETFSTKEAPPPQLCGEAAPTGDEMGTAAEWTDEVYVGNEDGNTPIQKVRSKHNSASFPNKSKGVNPNLHVPQFLSTDTDLTPESNLCSGQTQHQTFITATDLEKSEEVLLSTSGSDNSIQLFNASQNYSEEGIALEKSNPQVSNSLFYPLGRQYCTSRDTEAHIPESEALGGSPNLPQDYMETDTSGECFHGQCWNSPPDSSEPSGLVNSLSLLKSLSEHSSALEGLEVLKKRNTASKQRGPLQTRELAGSPEVRKPSVPVAAQAAPESPRLNRDTQQLFSLGSEEETAFLAVTPKQRDRKALDPQPVEFQGCQVQGSATSAVLVRGHSSQLDCSQGPGRPGLGSYTADACSWALALPHPRMQVDFLQFPEEESFPKGGDSFNTEDNFQVIAEPNKDSIENNTILDFPPKDSEHSYHYWDYNFQSAKRTSWEVRKVASPEPEVSMSHPVSAFPSDSRGEDLALEFSEEPLKARALPVMKNFSSLENENLQRLQVPPLTVVPPADWPPDKEPWSHAIACDRLPGSPLFDACEESVVPPLSSRPEAAPDASLLHRVSAQSKWLKYQNPPQRDLPTPGRADEDVADGFFAKAVSSVHFTDTGEGHSDAVRDSAPDSVRLQRVRDVLRRWQQGAGTRDFVHRDRESSWSLKPTCKAEAVQGVLGRAADAQEINVSELCFPSGQRVKSAYLPQRQTHIPATFQSPTHYKQVFTSCLIEHLNILLFGLAQRLHKALSTVDISFYTSSKGEKLRTSENNVPPCHHHQPAKLVMVKKEGPNKGRLFYTCDAPKADQCKFFKWFEEVTPGHLTQEESRPAMVLSDTKSIGLYLRSQNVPLYEECQLLVRKGFDFQRKQYGKLKKFTTVNPELCNEPKSKLYLKLSRKENSSTYSKDDLWVVSKTLDFELDTFIACSVFFGPSSADQVELLPLKGYFPSSWPVDTVAHALLVGNASTELTTLKNIRDHFNPATLPLTPHLLTMSSTTASNKKIDRRKFIPPGFSNTSMKYDLPSIEATLQLAREFIEAHKLNEDQAAALTQIARMVASPEEGTELRTCTPPIAIVHGVFGAGKSYLLAVVVLFLVQLFEKNGAPAVGNTRPWKVLVSSSTNVAVDRVLLGLLSLGFENFVRVGSVRKIAKPVLPYSLHAGSESADEQLKELHALMKEALTPSERACVRKSLEQHKLGTNRTLLKQVRVVGATCAACPFPCMNALKFPVVLLDECSQITEPASLLPIARFECEKLILVGDTKQLPPTIQGSDAAHENGLEQTLFDRLCLMGHKPVLLRTQYRCHPAISAVANDLFYEGSLRDGVSEKARSPLLAWLPTLCFYNVHGREQTEGGNSFHNAAEAAFTLKLIQSLVAGGVAGSAIGVITLYRSQMRKLCHLLRAADSAPPDLGAVQVSTVDAFQGAEKEVVILSCVRTRQTGFIDSEKRVNVALTRGRRHLLIVGSLACLRNNGLWARVIQHCEGREDGLQHASQCEPQLNRLLQGHLDKDTEEKRTEKSRKDTSGDKSHSQKDME